MKYFTHRTKVIKEMNDTGEKNWRRFLLHEMYISIYKLSSHPAFPFALGKEYIASTLYFAHPRKKSALVIRAGANNLYKVFNEECSNLHLDEAEKKSRYMWNQSWRALK